MTPKQMTQEKRRLLRVVVTINHSGIPWVRKATLARLLGKPVFGVARTANVMTKAGYLASKTEEGEACYSATDAGLAYYAERLANPLAKRTGNHGGRKPVIDPGIFNRAREMLAERDGQGRKVHTQAEVARALGVSVSALYYGLDPERRKARAKRRSKTST